MNRNRIIWLFVITIVVVPMSLFGIVKMYQHNFGVLPYLKGPEQNLGDFRFQDQNGNFVSRDDLNDNVVVANFFFSHCLSVCPKMFAQLKRVQANSSKDIMILSFTVDPERDSVERLKRYSSILRVEGNWHLLTGAKKDLYRFARKELFIVATDGDGGPDDFIHSENFVLLDKRGNIRGYYNGTDETEVNQLINDIKKLNK